MGFNTAYLGEPPWDIGRPQPAIVELYQARKIHGPVLDAGCGTGENALYLASEGLEVWGIDSAPRAIKRARRKSRERHLHTVFREFDALNLAQLGRTFDTVIDCGLFHTFEDEERRQWAASLASTLNSGGMYFMLCFSDREPGGWGPRRVSQAEIRDTFQQGWEVLDIRESHFDSKHLDNPSIAAWLASIRKTAPGTPDVW